MNVAELDDLLCNLTAAEAGAVRCAAEAGFVDQMDAAQRDALAIAVAAIQPRAGLVQHVAPAEIDGWLRLGAVATLAQWFCGRGRTCVHSPDPRLPAPVFSCAWKPGLVVCARCLALLAAPRRVDNVCDRCGRPCAGVESGDAIVPLAVVVGALTYQAGACGECVPELVAP
jgi:hypothetical protein